MEKVHTLWCNNNQISDLPTFLDSIQIKFPNLKFLSMMRNPACPGLMDLLQPDMDAIRMYRLYTLYRIPQLEILDGQYVTMEVSKMTLFIHTVCSLVLGNH